MSLLIEIRKQPTCLASAFGRVFYGADNRVYFSQVYLDDIQSIGKCYQKNDPTAEVTSDILDTDGGEILLQESGAILSMVEFQRGIVAFCERGAWYIRGSDSGFTATSYSVDKFTSERIVGLKAHCSVGSDLMFGTQGGLFSVSTDDFGNPRVTSLTDSTIRTRWKSFVNTNLLLHYDEKDRSVLCHKRFTGEVLVLNLETGGWYPWLFNSLNLSRVLDSVVYSTVDQRSYFIVRIGNEGGDPWTSWFLGINDQPSVSDYRDYGSGVYSSYLVTNYETLGNYTRNKGAPLVNVFFRKTETEVTAAWGEFTFDKPSACNMSVQWDFRTTAKEATRQIYDPAPRGWAPLLDGTSSFDTGDTVVQFKDKIRGKGKSVQFKFESVGSNAVEMLGFSVQYTAKGRM